MPTSGLGTINDNEGMPSLAIDDVVVTEGNGGGGRDIAIAAGTLIGAGLGNQIGKSLDRADRAALQQTTQRSLESSPSGQTTSWTNPDSGNSGTVTPQPAYTNASGQYCREFQQTITVGGEQQSGYGTACRQPDGSWEIKS